MDNVVYADCVLINGATVDAHFSFKRAIAVKQDGLLTLVKTGDSAAYWSPDAGH